jgi:hypothetical protein
MKATILLFVIQFVNSSLGSTILPDGIVVHHSALTREDVLQYPGPVTAETIDSLHEKRGFRVLYWGKIYHIGYHYLILPNGVIQSGRPEHCVGSHTRGYNSALGICLVGNFSSRENSQESPGNPQPTDAQMRALESLIRDISRRYGISCDKVHRHDELNPKTQCPGDRFQWTKLRIAIGCSAPR